VVQTRKASHGGAAVDMRPNISLLGLCHELGCGYRDLSLSLNDSLQVRNCIHQKIDTGHIFNRPFVNLN
jgi:hypothetical protein